MIHSWAMPQIPNRFSYFIYMKDRPLNIRNDKYSFDKPPWTPSKNTKNFAICFNCEYEWDIDKLSADVDCPDCGAQVGSSQEHTVRTSENS